MATSLPEAAVCQRQIVSSFLAIAPASIPAVRSFVHRSVYSQQATMARVQHPAPEFSGDAVFDGDFIELNKEQYKGKYLVLLFYPLDFTFVCPTELIAFSERMEDFKKLNAEVVGVSIDSKFTHWAFTQQARKDGGVGNLKFPLLSDITKKVSKDYGVLIEDAGIALRGLFIIDGNGIVRQITINDLPVGRSVDETLRLIKAFQFTDEHGEVCPANWNEGDATMKPEIAGSKEYFTKTYEA